MKNKNFYISLEQALRAMLLAYISKIFLILVGGNGAGKSSVCRDAHRLIAEKVKDLQFQQIDLSTMQAGDFFIPVPNHELRKVIYYSTDLFKFNEPDRRFVVFEELDRGDRDVMNIVSQLVLARQLHNFTLSDDVFMVGNMNGSADPEGTNPLTNALKTRSCFLYVSTNSTGAEEEFTDYCVRNKVNPAIAGFRKFRPDLVPAYEDYDELNMAANSRTLVMCGQLFDKAESVKFKTDDIILPMIAGLVGKATAIELWGFYKLRKEVPTVEEILKDPIGSKIHGDASVNWAVVCGLVHHADTAPKGLALLRYILRMPREIRKFAVKKLSEKCPDIIGSAEFIKFEKEV